MSRPKLPRKSTTIDMTAMCDVAFLLLSFFILTTKFKGEEAIPVNIPNSVASKVAPEKDIVLVSITNDGKVFLTMDDEDKKEAIANAIIAEKKINFDVNAFKKAKFFGSSFGQLPSFLATPQEERQAIKMPGIPCKDSINNELSEWMRIVVDAFKGQRMNLLLKGDNISKYPAFEQVIEAFKKNDLLKFQMVTNPESVPVGSDLWRDNQDKKPEAKEGEAKEG